MTNVVSRYQPHSRKIPGSSFLSPLGERTPGNYLQQQNRATTGGVGKVPAASTEAPRETVNVRGGSKDPNRGAWCTPQAVADALPEFGIDPFSNPRSHIKSLYRCMLEDGGDGFGGQAAPGSYRCGRDLYGEAHGATRVFLQPPYSIVEKAFRHYQHTRWVALLRFDPRPTWFDEIYWRAELVCVFSEIEFESPPGVSKGGGNSFPHALYYRRAEDVTPDVLKLAPIAWRKKPRG